MRFEFSLAPSWPPLAWLAKCHNSAPVVTVFHGRKVETLDDWFGEAVWAGDYSAGNLDQTDIVAGSGGRIRSGEVVFVSSGSTVDRLHSLCSEGGSWVSNSLPCLLAGVGAQIDPIYPKYFQLLRTIIRGIDKYQRFVPATVGRVQLTYFDNLVWDGRRLVVRPKPREVRDFSTFSHYRTFLTQAMEAVAQNMKAPMRNYPYQFLSTASSGYDSATVTTLAKQAGCEDVLCFDRARGGVDDSGEPFSRYLGLNPIVVQRQAWRSAKLPEVPFIAADAHGGDVFFKAAESLLAGKVLLTGFHGGKIWAKQTEDLSENIHRGDQSGLSLTEYRLGAGFIHCPIPFWGVRQIREVNAISNSAEMGPWDIPGDYSRPICRRIVEEAGVPRELFGTKKRAVWVRINSAKSFLTAGSRRDYLEWLNRKQGEWLRRARVPPIVNERFDEWEYSWRQSVRRALSKQHGIPLFVMRYSGLQLMVTVVGDRPTRLRRHAFPWAIEHQMTAYPRQL